MASTALEPRVVIIDNGGANVASLQFALQRLHCQPRLSTDISEIQRATHLILPGVGAAADAMRRLRDASLDQLIPTLRQPLLGICLGMQLLYEFSEEANTPCLGAIKGRVRRLAASPGVPVPHMGWNTLNFLSGSELLAGIPPGAHAYFVHGFAAPPGVETVASTTHGNAFSSVIRAGNFFGVQFHPERSASLGAALLANFLRLQ